MIEIKVKSRRYNCIMQLQQKLTIIHGDSGRGKTTFYNALSDEGGGFKIIVKPSNYELVPLTHVSWFDVVSMGIQLKSKRIYVIDDNDFIITKEFARVYKEDTLSYFIVINRFDTFNMQALNMLPFAVSEIYNLIGDGKEHYLQHSHSFSSVPLTRSIDYCILEDSNSGFNFFKVACNTVKVESTYGKDKVLNYLREHESELMSKRVLLIVDMAAFGSWIDMVRQFITIKHLNVVLLANYNSFEYLLLRSNMFKFDFSKLSNEELVSAGSLEQLSEKILMELSKNKFYHYDKKELSKCYSEPCCYRNQNITGSVIEHCDKGLEGDKIIALLEGTEFEELLVLHE